MDVDGGFHVSHIAHTARYGKANMPIRSATGDASQRYISHTLSESAATASKTPAIGSPGAPNPGRCVSARAELRGLDDGMEHS